jgi:type II secretory pathway component PulM
MSAAREAEAEVQEDLSEKLAPIMEGMAPRDRAMLAKAAAKLASKVVGQAVSADGDAGLQAIAMALASLNAYRESMGMGPVPQGVSAAALVGMIEDAMEDAAFMEFLKSDMSTMNSEGMESEDMNSEMEDEDSMTEDSKNLMGRRAAFMGGL